MNRIPYAAAVRVAVLYVIFSSLWIFLSDFVLLLFLDDIEAYRNLSTLKGLFFIMVSGVLIYSLVRRELRLLEDASMSIDKLERFDTLTGLSNRRQFSIELDRINQTGQPVSVILSDINGLKLYNEVYSSQEGDRLLARYAELLKAVMPERSFIARIGGDEFCVLLDHCDGERLERMVQRLSERISQEQTATAGYTVAIGSASSCDEDTSVYETVSIAEDRMYKNKLLLARSASNALISSLKTTLFERSDETEQHAARLEQICRDMGEHFHMTTSEIDDLKLFAILHDIGKIGISDAILNKPGKLTVIEFNLMKQHPAIGYRMASSVPILESIAYNILTHHERWDGTGYPKGLKTTDIPLASRILAVADAYDAMTNDRIYRKALSREDAIAELVRNKGTQFDPQVVDVFIEQQKNHPFEG